MSRPTAVSSSAVGERPVTPAAAAFAPRIFLVVVMLAAALIGLTPLLVTPPAAPASAPAADFSAVRAMQHLAQIAAVPHPVGSPANADVRDYLVAEIGRLGLTAEVQSTIVSELSPLSGIAQVTPVENVLVRVPGTAGGAGAVLVTGHYDSVPTTPGAGDCGSCAAAVLETLRATLAGPRLQNDLIFLFTDAEELGIVGATALMRQHAFAQDVRLSLVLEGLGTAGSSLLYATGADNGGFVRKALAVMDSPAGYAYLHDVMWKVAGNSGSDLDAFVAEGRPGLAFVHLSLDGSQAYHSGADNVESLNIGTLQQHGDQTLSLVRHFGNAALDDLDAAQEREPDAVYFSLLPSLVIAYPQALAQPLAIVAALAALASVAFGRHRRAFSLGALLGSLFVPLLGLLLAVAVGTATWSMLRTWNVNHHIYALGGWYGAGWTTAGLTLLGLALTVGLHWLWRLRLSAGSLAASGLLWFAALALLTAAALPGFSHLFAWPLLAAAPAVAWGWSQRAAAHKPWPRALLSALPAAVAITLVAPVVYGLAVFAGRMEGITALPLAALPLPLVVLVGMLLAPQWEFLMPARRRQLPVLLLGAALLLLAIGWLRSGFDAGHPKLNSITYWLDADSGAAHWISVNDSRAGRGSAGQLDEWTEQFLGDDPMPTTFNPWLSGWFLADYPALQNAAAAIDLPHSLVNVQVDSMVDGERLLRLQITPADGLQDMFVQLSGAPDLRLTALNGVAVLGTAGPMVRVNLVGGPDAPTTIELRSAETGPLTVSVQDRRLGLPDAGLIVEPRPQWMAAAPFNDISDSTVVAYTLVTNMGLEFEP